MKFFDKIIEYGILLLVFLIPYQARWILSGGQINGGYWEYGTQLIYATEILLGGILVLLIIKFVARVVETQNFASLRGRRFNIKRLLSPHGAVLLFLIYAGLSVFWSIDKNTALIHWRFLVEAGVVFLILVRTRRGAFVQKIQWAIILSAVIQAMWGIGQFLMQSIPGSTILGMAHQGAEVLGASVVETLDGRWLRAYGSFPHPNILGGWLVLGLIVILSVAKRSRRIPAIIHEIPRQARNDGLKKILLLLSFVIILFGLLATFSRSAWLAFGVVLIAVILSVAKRSRRIPAIIHEIPRQARNDGLKLFATTILVIISFSTLFPNLLSARVDSQNRLEAKATSERLVGFSQSWQIIKNHPLLGVGIGNYGLAVRDEIDSTQNAWYYQPVHNLPLLIWAELGLAGILIMGYGLWVMARKSIFWLIPLAPLFLLDHYLWSLYPGVMILAVWLGLLTPPLAKGGVDKIKRRCIISKLPQVEPISSGA